MDGTPSPHSSVKPARAPASCDSASANSSACGTSASASRLDVGELVAQAGEVGLEAGDHGLVDERGAIALDAALALGEHGGQAAGPLPHRLEPHQGLGQIAGAVRRQGRFGTENVRVELREAGLRRRLVRRQLRRGP